MTNQRIRNLSTGRLHTKMSDIYEDIEYIVGESGIMTHMLPTAREALLPWLRTQVPDARFWEDVYDPQHDGETALSPMTLDEQKQFWYLYESL